MHVVYQHISSVICDGALLQAGSFSSPGETGDVAFGVATGAAAGTFGREATTTTDGDEATTAIMEAEAALRLHHHLLLQPTTLLLLLPPLRPPQLAEAAEQAAPWVTRPTTTWSAMSLPARLKVSCDMQMHRLTHCFSLRRMLYWRNHRILLR